MDFQASSETIKNLLINSRVYVIPRFQRQYSWNKNNNEELLEDLISQITYKENSSDQCFSTSNYYLGNMIFLGKQTSDEVEIIDGQQRMTAGTILLAAIRDSLRSVSKDDEDDAYNYAQTIQDHYLIDHSDGEVHRKLKTKSTYPYFAQMILRDKHDNAEISPISAEEKNLKVTFDFFKEQLEQKKLFKKFQMNCNIPDFCNKVKNKNNEKIYIELLKALRDQFVESEVIAIFVDNSKSAYRIFENINSKGQPLSQGDLIKNNIFSKIENNEVGVDFPLVMWNKVTETIDELNVKLDDFILHFWRSKYPQDSANKANLYKKYISRFGNSNATEEKIIKLIKDLESASKNYEKIVKPSKDDYKQQETLPIWQSLAAINNFGGVQTRSALLSYLSIDSKKKIKHKDEISFFKFLANFNFAAFGTSLKLRSNQTTNKYKIFCQKINESKNSSDVRKAIKVLESDLLSLIKPDDFKRAFVNLKFSSAPARKSAIFYPTTYAIRTIANHMDNSLYDDNKSSIEHILDESGNKEELLNIGNLTVFETQLNNKLGSKKPGKYSNNINYKLPYYEKSSHKMTRDLCKKGFTEKNISSRASDLAEYFWKYFFEQYK